MPSGKPRYAERREARAGAARRVTCEDRGGMPRTWTSFVNMMALRRERVSLGVSEEKKKS